MITEGESCPRYYPTPGPSSRRHAARHDYAEALPPGCAPPHATISTPLDQLIQEAELAA